MKLFKALIKSYKNTGNMEVIFKENIYVLNAYDGSLKEGNLDLRTGFGGWDEHTLNLKELQSDEFEPII